MPPIFDDVMDTQAEVDRVASRLRASAPIDDRGRRLRVRISRVGSEYSRQQQKLFNALIADISRQIALTDAGEYVHYSEATACARKLSHEQWRGVFTSIVLGLDSVPNPEQAGSVIMLLRSSKDMTSAQYNAAIDLAQAFGDIRGVRWANVGQE